MNTARRVAVAALLLSGCVEMQPSVVEPDRYLGARSNPSAIYADGATRGVIPIFDVRFEPMDRLMLVNFGDDPVYAGIELQAFDTEDGGESALALLWRKDGVVDVYTTPNHRMTDEHRRSLENLLNEITLQVADFEYRLNVTEHGLDSAFRIRDREGRDVSFEVVETRGRPRLGALIAPVGATVERPEYLPLIFLDDFALVRRRGARIRIEIDGHERTPEKMTRLVRGPASYFTRYSTRVVIANWNERREAVLSPFPVQPGTNQVTDGDLAYRLVWNGAHPEVEAVVARQAEDRVTFRFSPALPDLAALRDGAAVEGRFVINVNDVEGITAGEYRVARAGRTALLELRPLNAWQPPILKGAPWVASYLYDARIDLTADVPVLHSEWRRQGE